MRWSSQSEKGCVPAAPIRRPRSLAAVATSRRSPASWRPASAVSSQGVVAISQTDSISSGLTSPADSDVERSWSSPSIELASSSVSASTIISSSSIPRV